MDLTKTAQDFLHILKKPENIRQQELLSEHTTFRIGGPADFFLTPEDEEQLMDVTAFCRERGIPYFLIGNGSNLLVSDDGYRGVIISLQKYFKEISADGGRISAGAGGLLSSLAAKAAEHSLSGLEFASGIPGTVGGAVMMNAGAYGGEICQVLTKARVFCDGVVKNFEAEELKFGYRHSLLMENGGIVLSAEFSLTQGDEREIRSRMAEYNRKRRMKQPIEYPSAGSTFKRPEGYFAGKLIEDAGMRGYRIGGIEVSEKHSGFVINKGGGTAEDVVKIIEDIRKAVQEKFGVAMEPEIRFLGFDRLPWG